MATKELEITLPELDELILNVEYTYTFTLGKYHGRPEDCYPEDEEAEVCLPDGYERMIFKHYLAAARNAIKHVEAYVSNIKPYEVADWQEETDRNYAEDKAEARFEAARGY